MPSFEDDFSLLSIGLITSTLVVRNVSYGLYASNRDKLAILKTDGTFEYRSIGASTVDVDGNEELNITAPLNIDASEIVQISYLVNVRLASDDVLFTWVSNQYVEATVTLLGYDL